MIDMFFAKFIAGGRGFVVFVGLILIWWAAAAFFHVPSYMLPTPPLVALRRSFGRKPGALARF